MEPRGPRKPRVSPWTYLQIIASISSFNFIQHLGFELKDSALCASQHPSKPRHQRNGVPNRPTTPSQSIFLRHAWVKTTTRPSMPGKHSQSHQYGSSLYISGQIGSLNGNWAEKFHQKITTICQSHPQITTPSGIGRSELYIKAHAPKQHLQLRFQQDA